MIKNKLLGFILIGISIFFIVSILIFKYQVNKLTEELMIETGGSCIVEGKCLHEQSNLPVYLGVALTFMTLALGVYLILFEKVEQKVEKIHKDIVDSLKDTKKEQDKNEKFEFFLKALNEDEKKVIIAVKDQDGIEQSTLRIRTDLSKTKLSVILSELEKKNLIRKLPSGKKNKIYLKNLF